MPEKIIEALTKAWRDLTVRERQELAVGLKGTAGLSGATAALLAETVIFPEAFPIVAPLIILTAGGAGFTAGLFGLGKTGLKFIKSFEHHIGSPIERAFEKLKGVV